MRQRRGSLGAGARLLAHVQDMVVGSHAGLLHVPVECLPHAGLRDAVEVDVVLADELVGAGILAGPPVVPVEADVRVGGLVHDHGRGIVHELGVGDGALGELGGRCARGLELGGVACEDGAGEADGRPQALGPDPGREVAAALDLGQGHAPLDVARDAERHERFAGAEAHAGSVEDLVGLVALAPGGEDHREGALVALGLDDLVRG
ncbi:Uncharacterised protein [Collinsella intestinalis]|nr:Uncharacterised protein [Collinsella intestinalis]